MSYILRVFTEIGFIYEVIINGQAVYSAFSEQAARTFAPGLSISNFRLEDYE